MVDEIRVVLAQQGLVADDVVLVLEGWRFEDFAPVHGVHVADGFQLEKKCVKVIERL